MASDESAGVAGQELAGPRWLLSCGLGLGDVAAMVWGFAEATLFFVIPDILLTYTAAWSWRHAMRQMVMAVIGAVLGGMCIFTWSWEKPEAARDAVEAVPFVRPYMMEKVEADLHKYGVWALCIGPTNGVPYKAYAVAAPAYTESRMMFAGVSIPARAERFVITVGVAALVGWWIRRKAKRPQRVILLVHGITWIVFYAVYWTVVSLR